MNKKVYLVLLFAVFVMFAIIFLPSENAPETYIKPYEEAKSDCIRVTCNLNNDRISPEEVFSNSIIKISHTAVVCEYLGQTESNSKYHKFLNVETVYGYAPDEYIYSPVSYSFPYEFTENSRYLLILTRSESIFHPFPIYELWINAYFPLDNTDMLKWEFGTVELENRATIEDFVTFIKHTAENGGYNVHDNAYLPNIFRDESLETVIKNTDLLLKVTAKGVYNADNYSVSEKYSFTVDEVLKGDYNKELFDTVIISVLPHTVETDKEYIMAVCPANKGNTGSSFMQCAENGIIPLENEALVKEVYSYLGK